MKFEKPVLEVISSETIKTSIKKDGSLNMAPENASGNSWSGKCCYKSD